MGLLVLPLTGVTIAAQLRRTQVSVLKVVLPAFNLPRSTWTFIAVLRAFLFFPWWPVPPGRRPEHTPSAAGHCLGTGDVFLF